MTRSNNGKPRRDYEGRGGVVDRQRDPPSLALFAMDSGAHSLYNEEVLKKDKVRNDYSYFQLSNRKFRRYVDRYAKFIKKHRSCIDMYVNVDVIYNPELTWETQLYLEKEHGLNPVPVVHLNTGLEWVEKYVRRGHEILGIGGLGQGATAENYTDWADQVFDFLCPLPSRLPIIKPHGFAMTSCALMRRYPWWSVDSASWAKVGAHGSIYAPIPKWKGGFAFGEEFGDQPNIVNFSYRSPTLEEGKPKAFVYMNSELQQGVLRWLKKINVPFGEIGDADGHPVNMLEAAELLQREAEEAKKPKKKDREKVLTVLERGVISHYGSRGIANLRFFEEFVKTLPDWPYPWREPQKRRGAFA